ADSGVELRPRLPPETPRNWSPIVESPADASVVRLHKLLQRFQMPAIFFLQHADDDGDHKFLEAARRDLALELDPCPTVSSLNVIAIDDLDAVHLVARRVAFVELE